jgi:hypothetical protein
MSSHKERFADKMEFPPATEQPNIYPLSWNVKTKKLQEVWEASLRENWDPEKLPWDTLDVDSYTWEERESIAYWWSLLSVFDASAPPVFAEALIKTYEVHEEDPVRKCFFSVTRDEQNHEIMCGLAITKMLGHPDPITYEPKTDLGRRLQKNVKWLYFNGGRYWTGYKKAVPKYDLAVLFSSFLMGEIAAATIFKQMFDNSREAVFKEGFKNIGRDEGRHMAICMAVMERDYPGGAGFGIPSYEAKKENWKNAMINLKGVLDRYNIPFPAIPEVGISGQEVSDVDLDDIIPVF